MLYGQGSVLMLLSLSILCLFCCFFWLLRQCSERPPLFPTSAMMLRRNARSRRRSLLGSRAVLLTGSGGSKSVSAVPPIPEHLRSVHNEPADLPRSRSHDHEWCPVGGL